MCVCFFLKYCQSEPFTPIQPLLMACIILTIYNVYDYSMFTCTQQIYFASLIQLVAIARLNIMHKCNKVLWAHFRIGIPHICTIKYKWAHFIGWLVGLLALRLYYNVNAVYHRWRMKGGRERAKKTVSLISVCSEPEESFVELYMQKCSSYAHDALTTIIKCRLHNGNNSNSRIIFHFVRIFLFWQIHLFHFWREINYFFMF